jgi:hypothetical protein
LGKIPNYSASNHAFVAGDVYFGGGIHVLVFGLWKKVFGGWSLAVGLWRLVFGPWKKVFGFWSLVFGGRSLGAGLCSLVMIWKKNSKS